MILKGPSIGLIELKSIARGMTVTDAMLKQAPVHLLEAQPISPGKYMTLICGEVADVDESLKVGIAGSGDLLINHLFLPQVHSTLIPTLAGTSTVSKYRSIGVIETFSVASCIQAADIAAKTADVNLVKIRLANGLGGKAYFVITGALPDVEASLSAASENVKKEGLLTACEIIQNPHPDFLLKGACW